MTSRMQAARVLAQGLVACELAPRPTSKADGDVLLRTRIAAICGSDIHNILFGTGPEPYPCPPGYPGHESVGEVLEPGVAGLTPGQLVLAVPDISCAAGFAEFQVVPVRYLVPLPPEAELPQIVLAQQLGTVVYAMKRFWSGPVAPCAAVVGAGPAGLLFLQLLKRAGFGQVLISDVIPGRLSQARRLGADMALHAPGESIAEAALEVTGGVGADLVIEAAGTPDSRAMAVETVRVDGRIGFFGSPETLAPVLFPFSDMFRKRPTVTSSWGAQHEAGLASFHTAVEMILSAAVNVGGFISHTFPVARIDEAIRLAARPDDSVLKVAIGFDG
jgi:L-iditol 2-dehydrogenase